jgi:glycosyltransferase involved in cell wall biosynthesis
MAVVRIHLITFRRPALLPRAVQSLRDQTFRDWICEVQNGDPEDQGPGRLIDSLNDSRFKLFIPPRRIGPVEAFNLAHRQALEPYQSLLEDDNWWEPAFLEKMIAALEAHPEAGLAWSNMRTWRERGDGGWDDTGLPVWSRLPGGQPRLFRWPHLIQFGDSIYSNGSMLLRSHLAPKLVISPATPRDMFEQAREHLMDFPILLVPDLLANFALTRQTMRSIGSSGWGETQALLGAAFLARVPMTDPARAALWAHRRRLRPRSTNGLIYAGLLQRDLKFLRHATAADWAAFARGAARHPGTAWRVFRAKPRFADTWRWLDAATAARTEEARRRGFVALTENSLIDKKNPDGPCHGA